MPIFRSKDKTLLFIHIPKNGGTSIEAWLSQYCGISLYANERVESFKVSPQHLQLKDISILLGENAWDYAFSIVRDPYARVESEYFFNIPAFNKHLIKKEGFSRWVINNINICSADPFYLDNHLRPQTDFLGSGVEIFRYEDSLEKAVEVISRKAGGIPFAKKLANIRPRPKAITRFPVTWSNEAIEVVNEFYKNDFKELEYKIRQ